MDIGGIHLGTEITLGNVLTLISMLVAALSVKGNIEKSQAVILEKHEALENCAERYTKIKVSKSVKEKRHFIPAFITLRVMLLRKAYASRKIACMSKSLRIMIFISPVLISSALALACS